MESSIHCVKRQCVNHQSANYVTTSIDAALFNPFGLGVKKKEGEKVQQEIGGKITQLSNVSLACFHSSISAIYLQQPTLPLSNNLRVLRLEPD